MSDEEKERETTRAALVPTRRSRKRKLRRAGSEDTMTSSPGADQTRGRESGEAGERELKQLQLLEMTLAIVRTRGEASGNFRKVAILN